MKFMFAAVLLSLLVSCAGETGDGNVQENPTLEETSRLDLTFKIGSNVFGEGVTQSTTQSPIDCTNPSFSWILNLKNRIAFGTSTNATCGACDLVLKCEPGEAISIDAVLWDGVAEGGSTGIISGTCDSNGEFTGATTYGGMTDYLKVTATMGDLEDVEYIQCQSIGF